MKISTDGRCPKCGSYKVAAQLSLRQFSCADCAEKYISLTGSAALHWRKTHPDNDGIFVEKSTPNETTQAPTPFGASTGSAMCGWIISPPGWPYRECGRPATHRDPSTGEGMCNVHAEDYADVFGSQSLVCIDSESPNADHLTTLTPRRTTRKTND